VGDDVVVLHPSATQTDTAPPTWRERWLAPLDPPLAFGVFVAGVVLVGLARWLEPPAAHPDAAVPLWLLAIDTAVWGGLCFAGIGLVRFRRVGLLGAAVAAGALAVESAACIATGHHAFGVWWLGQVACVSAFGGIVHAATRVSARGSGAPGPRAPGSAARR
jgi:hypothetical protein